MTGKHSFSRFVYFDTNILSQVSKKGRLWRPLSDFLTQNDLTLGISTAQLLEICDASRLHLDLVALLLSVPSGLLKTPEMILDEEIESHPQERARPLLFYPINAMLLEEGGIEKLLHFISSPEMHSGRSVQLTAAKQMAARHLLLKSNFPPSETGEYTQLQADKFASLKVIEWLADARENFVRTVQCDVSNFHPEVFKTIQLFARVIYYKYYLGQREPKRLSDFGDLSHLYYIPYCELAVMERDLCEILRQVKRNCHILDSTEVRNIEFLGELE